MNAIEEDREDAAQERERAREMEQVPMTPERLEEIVNLFGGEPTSATLAAAAHAAVSAWEAQVDRIAGALADLSMAYAGIRKRLETAEEQLAVNVDFVKQYQTQVGNLKQEITHLKNCNMRAAEMRGENLEQIEKMRHALHMLTYSPDGFLNTWPPEELVHTALAASTMLCLHEWAPGYEYNGVVMSWVCTICGARTEVKP